VTDDVPLVTNEKRGGAWERGGAYKLFSPTKKKSNERKNKIKLKSGDTE
jgi:hypothetical protein